MLTITPNVRRPLSDDPLGCGRVQAKAVEHSPKYYEDIDRARRQIQSAEENMKKMDAEERAFHAHMAKSMQELM